MAFRVLIAHILGYSLPLHFAFAMLASPERPLFGAFGDSVLWDLLRLIAVTIGASGAFLLWKFILQPELHGFRYNPSQRREVVERVMKRFPKFYDTKEAEFGWVTQFEQCAPEILSELNAYLRRSSAKQAFHTAYDNEILSLSPSWATLNLISYGLDNSTELPRTLELVRQIPNVFTCNVSRMKPQSALKEHAGEASCYVRCHMGLIVPATAPTTALHVGGTTQPWATGKVTAFCDAHWHGAVNGADNYRYVLIFDIMRKRLGWYTEQYCALMLALNVTIYLLPGRFSLDEPLWRPGIFASYVGFGTIGLPLITSYYLYFKHSDKARPTWTKRLRDAGFGFYY